MGLESVGLGTHNSYALDRNMYPGKKEEGNNFLLQEQVVINIIHGLLNQNHHVYLENFFSVLFIS